MMTTSQPPNSQPPANVDRAKPAGWPRVATAYLLTLISVAVGAIALVGGVIGAQTCDSEGLACLGWLFVGAAAWALLAVVLLVVLALRQRLGLLFVVITVAVVAVALATPGIEPVRVLLGLLAPGLAAWVTGPSTGARRRRPLLIGVLALPGLVLSTGIVADQMKTAGYRESLYVREAVAPVGLADDRGWDYTLVMESVIDRGFTYQMEDGSGREVRVEIVHAGDTPLAPPTNCSRYEGPGIACEQRADGVFRSPEDARQHRIVVRGQSVVRVVLLSEGAFDEAEFDRLVMSMQTQSPRWLAERECALCRVLPD